MSDCLLLGDSIAVGVAQHRLECRVEARVGAQAAAFVATQTSADTVIVSLGSNDAADPTDALHRLRSRITARRVVWIVPAYRWAEQVRAVARQHGDTSITYMAGPDRVHPASYRTLAALTQETDRE